MRESAHLLVRYRELRDAGVIYGRHCTGAEREAGCVTAQPHLFKPGPATGNLTDRQATVLAMLQAEPAGMRALDVGIALHAEDGCSYCTPQSACKYAHPNATAILKALRKKNLAIHRKTGLWQALVPAGRDTGTFPPDF